MASSSIPMGVDMNIPSNFRFYSEILVFKTDRSRSEIVFEHCPTSEQRSLQAIAHQLGLDFEYSKVSQTATISRADVPHVTTQDFGKAHGHQSSMNPMNLGECENVDCQRNSGPLVTDSASSSVLIPSSIFNSAFSVELYAAESSLAFSPSTSLVSSGQTDETPSIVALSPQNLNVGPSVNLSVKRKHSGGGQSSRSYIPKGPWSAWRGKRKAESSESKSSILSPATPNLHFCGVCRKHFSRLEDLKSHEQLHAPECDLSFRRGELMLRQEVHSAPQFLPSSTNAQRNTTHRARSSTLSPSAFMSPPGEIDDRLVTPRISSYDRTESIPSSNYSDFDPGSIFSGQSSIYSQGDSGYREGIFDSSSTYSGGEFSTISGRRGPLSDWARAGANAVKKVGACWRCKFLRKSCDPDTPCALCPRGDRSRWEAVGCRRGNFQPELPLNSLCIRRPLSNNADEEKRVICALSCSSLDTAARRDAWVQLEHSLEGPNLLSDQHAHAREMLAQAFSNACSSVATPPNSVSLEPVKECVMAIMWEFLEHPSTVTKLGIIGGFDFLVRLLIPAAVYQASQEKNQIISQSLICLRSCLEAIRKKNSGFVDEYSHAYCSPSSLDCKVEYIATVNMHSQSYFNELSKVMFKKENIRKKSLCYLSIFYSLCIQSIVRKVLLALTADSQPAYEQSKHFLHIPLRLFIAGSGNHDPLARNFLSLSKESDEYEQARQAVGHDDWCLSGVKDSASYLKSLFEDDGTPLSVNHDHPGMYDLSMIDSSFEDYDSGDLLGSVDYLTAFWDADATGKRNESVFGSL